MHTLKVTLAVVTVALAVSLAFHWPGEIREASPKSNDAAVDVGPAVTPSPPAAAAISAAPSSPSATRQEGTIDRNLPPRRTSHADDLLPRIAKAPEPSAQIHPVPRASIPDEAYMRLMSRLYAAKENAKTSGIDANARPATGDPTTRFGLQRPAGDRASIRDSGERAR